jgi:hypothetical protein
MLCPILTFPSKAALLKEKLMTQWIIWILKYSIPLFCSLYETVIYSLLQYLRIPRFDIWLFVLFNASLICFVSYWLVSFCFDWFRFDWFRFVSIGSVSFLLVSFRFNRFRFVSFWFRFALYTDPSFEQTWSPFPQGWFIPSLVKIGTVVLEKIFKWPHPIFTFLGLYPLWRGPGSSFKQIWISFTQG